MKFIKEHHYYLFQNLQFQTKKNIIAKINKQSKDERFLKSEGVEISNILETKRGKNKLLEALK